MKGTFTVRQSAALRTLVEKTVANTPVYDIHTHLYDPAFGDLLLYGIDDLLVYHYLVAEAFRYFDIPYEKFWALTKEQQAKIVGKYVRVGGGLWEITQQDGKLFFSVSGTPLEMIAHSSEEFGLKYTAGKLTLKYDQSGTPTDLQFYMGGDVSKATRME